MFDHSGEYPLRFPEPIAGIKQAIDHGAIARPLLDFVEVAAVRQERIVGFLWAQSLIVGPLAAVARASLHALRSVIQLNCELRYSSGRGCGAEEKPKRGGMQHACGPRQLRRRRGTGSCLG